MQAGGTDRPLFGESDHENSFSHPVPPERGKPSQRSLERSGETVEAFRTVCSQLLQRRALGALTVALAAAYVATYAVALYRKYTPLYAPIVCRNLTMQTPDVVLNMDVDVSITGGFSMACTNPNKYRLSVRGQPGTISLGASETLLERYGSCLLRDGEFRAGATSQVAADCHVSLPWGDNAEGVVSGGAQVAIDLAAQVSVAEDFAFRRWAMRFPVAVVCGAALVMQGIPKLGSFTCGGDFHDLDIPAGHPRGSGGGNRGGDRGGDHGGDRGGEPAFVVRLPEDVLGPAARMKNGTLLSCILLGYGVALGFLAFAARSLKGLDASGPSQLPWVAEPRGASDAAKLAVGTPLSEVRPCSRADSELTPLTS